MADPYSSCDRLLLPFFFFFPYLLGSLASSSSSSSSSPCQGFGWFPILKAFCMGRRCSVMIRLLLVTC
ncbi:hypothetical protein XELAEV_18002866mg [Xenopus laevis]|uniref:Uncharacterized protein n=1 Tax=Xenopus laevis TaxID=8355 RepID=A0A974GYB3_XENLA|nr:hypothetical protein XELAEV_18002866mg [Xenopus laevis]